MLIDLAILEDRNVIEKEAENLRTIQKISEQRTWEEHGLQKTDVLGAKYILWKLMYMNADVYHAMSGHNRARET
jgi:hypothetical protein